MGVVLVVSCSRGQLARVCVSMQHTEMEVVRLAIAKDHDEADDVVER
jgi:hypothetical protein